MNARRSADVLKDMLLYNVEALKADPVAVLNDLAQKAVAETPRVLETDRVIYRTIVGTLCFVVALGASGYVATILIVGWKIEMPPELNSLMMGCVGYLAAVLKGDSKG